MSEWTSKTILLKCMSPDKLGTDKSLTITLFCPPETEMYFQQQNIACTDFSFFILSF